MIDQKSDKQARLWDILWYLSKTGDFLEAWDVTQWWVSDTRRQRVVIDTIQKDLNRLTTNEYVTRMHVSKNGIRRFVYSITQRGKRALEEKGEGIATLRL